MLVYGQLVFDKKKKQKENRKSRNDDGPACAA